MKKVHRLHRFTQIIKKNQCNQCNLWFLLFHLFNFYPSTLLPFILSSSPGEAAASGETTMKKAHELHELHEKGKTYHVTKKSIFFV
jgi:hypothetical protein